MPRIFTGKCLIAALYTLCLLASNPIVAFAAQQTRQPATASDQSDSVRLVIFEKDFGRLGADSDDSRGFVQDPTRPPDSTRFVIAPDQDLRFGLADFFRGDTDNQQIFEPMGAGDYSTGTEQEYPYAPLTSLSEVAALFPTPGQTTKLFLNFEGSAAELVSSFQATTDNRERDIQEIMFRTAQTFAPFNVEVQQFVGNGQMAESGGHTTIFIGDKMGNTVWMENNDGSFHINYKRAFADGDYPCLNRSVFHQPNSDEFNTGFVDPLSYSENAGWDSNDNDSIARAIGHEAGHTFGLAHVKSGTTPDLMSYSTSNKRAIYTEFPLTSDNAVLGGGVAEDLGWAAVWTYLIHSGFGETEFVAHKLDTQSSYRVLTCTLGLRDTSTDVANIANSELVHGGIYVDADAYSIGTGGMIPSQIEAGGDYDVFDFTPNTTQPIRVQAVAYDDNVWFDPILMVFDGNGDEILAYDRDSGDGKDAEIVFQAVKDQHYKIVVGAYSNNTFGNYQLSTEVAIFQINPNVDPADDLQIERRGPDFSRPAGVQGLLSR